jgi:hypothetical protein
LSYVIDVGGLHSRLMRELYGGLARYLVELSPQGSVPPTDRMKTIEENLS